MRKATGLFHHRSVPNILFIPSPRGPKGRRERNPGEWIHLLDLNGMRTEMLWGRPPAAFPRNKVFLSPSTARRTVEGRLHLPSYATHLLE